MPLMLLYNTDQMLRAPLSTRKASLSSVSTDVPMPFIVLLCPPNSLSIHSAFSSHDRREHSFQLKFLFESSMSSPDIKHN